MEEECVRRWEEGVRGRMNARGNGGAGESGRERET